MKMKSALKQFFLFLLTTFMLSQTVSAEIQGLQDFKGKPQKLENFTGKGKWLVVMMWASDCHVCNREAHQYVDFHLVHSDKDATVLGLSLDGEARKAAAKGFIKKHNIDFPNLIGEPEQVGEIYTELTGQYFAGTPTFLVFSPDGELKAAQPGAVPTEIIENFISSNKVVKTSK